VSEQRVSRAERALGVGSDPRVPCPRCAGSGAVFSEDGDHQWWVVRKRVHDVKCEKARRDGEPEPPAFDVPEPDEQPRPCPYCYGVGTASAAAMAEYERDSAEGRRLVDQMLGALQRHHWRSDDEPG
jgi:hypothetical protein